MATARGSTPGRLDAAASWLLPLVVGAVAWAGAYPPMGDLPMHEGIAALLAHHGEAEWAPSGLYETSLGHPQQLVQLFMAATMLVLPSAVAAKLVASASIAGIMAATARLLRHVGRTPWAAGLVAPIALGWLYHWGFVSNLAGIAIFGLLAVDLDRLAEAPSVRRSAVAGVGIVIAFLAHATSALAAVVALGIFVLVRRRRVALALAPSGVLVVALLVERYRERAQPTVLAEVFASRTLWHTPLAKVRQLPAYVAGRYDWPLRIAVLATVVVVLFVLVQHLVRNERAASGERRLVEHRFGLVAGVLFILFFAMPYSINYGAFLYVRMFSPAWVCLVVWLAPSRPSLAVRLAPLACVVASIVALAPEIHRANAQHEMLAALFRHIARGSSVAIVSYGKTPRTTFSPVSAGQRVLAERGGRALFSYAEYPTSPVTIRPEKRWDPLVARVYQAPGALRPSTDLDVIRYVLAWVPDAGLWPLLEAGFLPDARLIGQSGEWLLFESTHAVRPIDAPLPPASESSDTIQSRVNALVKPDRPPEAAAPAPP